MLSKKIYDFGLIGADGGSACVGNCVIAGVGSHSFSSGGLAVGAIGYNAADAQAYVTQKPGAFGTGETGLGESDTSPSPSDSDYEITAKTWLLLDNSAVLAAGWKSFSVSIESLQSGERAKIYSYSGALGTLDPTKLTLLDTMAGTPATQTFDFGSNVTYLVVQGNTPAGGSTAADVVLSQEVFSMVVGSSVPEPSTWAMMLLGFAGLGYAGLRSRQTAISIV